MLGRFLLIVALALIPRFVPAQGGSPVGPEFRVNTFTTNHQDYPSIASDSSGNFVVVWASEGQDGLALGIFAQRYSSSGAVVGPEFRVNTFTSNDQFRPSVARDSSGNFVIAWGSVVQPGVVYGVFGQRYANTGTPLGPEFRVNTYTSGFAFEPFVAFDSVGNFVVVWQSSQDGSDFGVFGQRYASTGVPLGSEFRVNSYTSNGQSLPSVASDGAGNFIVVWDSYTQDGSFDGVFGQRYAASGLPLGPEFRVNTYTTSPQRLPSVAASSSGNFVVVWASHNQYDVSWGIFGQRYAGSGLPLGPEFHINTYTTDGQSDPHAVFDDAGNFVVVWSSNTQDGSNYGVFGQRYANTGIPLGPEFRVSTYTANAQWVSAVSSDAAGTFVVAWDSALQDGSGRGIFAQRYSPIVPVELMGFRVE